MSTSFRGEVLVADADASIRSLLAVIVRRMNRKAVPAADGRAVVELLTSREFDAVVLDLLLPEVSGREILAELAKKRPEILPRIVVITTGAVDGDGAAGGVAAILRKPFAVDDLSRILGDCCEAKKSPAARPNSD